MLAELKSTADLRKMQKHQRRSYVKLKCEESEVVVTCVGGFYRARLKGHADSVIASTPSEAKQRLTKLLTLGSVVIPKSCDVAAERADKRGVL